MYKMHGNNDLYKIAQSVIIIIIIIIFYVHKVCKLESHRDLNATRRCPHRIIYFYNIIYVYLNNF